MKLPSQLRWTKDLVVLEALSLLSLVFLLLYTLIRWPGLPEQIPSHFNFAGEIDGWSGKGVAWLLPGIAVFLYALMTLVLFLPNSWNLPVTVTEENRERLLLATQRLLAVIKLTCLLLFTVLHLYTLAAKPLGWFFLPLFLAAVFGPLLFYFIHVGKKPEAR